MIEKDFWNWNWTKPFSLGHVYLQTFERFETSVDLPGLRFCEWPGNYNFFGYNLRWKTREIFSAQNFLQIKYHGILVYHVNKSCVIFSVGPLILYCESFRWFRSNWHFSLWIYSLEFANFFEWKELLFFSTSCRVSHSRLQFWKTRLIKCNKNMVSYSQNFYSYC